MKYKDEMYYGCLLVLFVNLLFSIALNPIKETNYELSFYSIICVILLSAGLIYGFYCYVDRTAYGTVVFEACMVFVSLGGLLSGFIVNVAGNDLVGLIYNYITDGSRYSLFETCGLLFVIYIFVILRNETIETYSILSSFIFSFFIISGYLYKEANVYFELFSDWGFLLVNVVLFWGIAIFFQCMIKLSTCLLKLR